MTFKRHLTSHRIINTWFVVPNTFSVIILMAVKNSEVTLGSSAGKATHVLERGLKIQKVRRAALPLEEVIFLLKSPQFFHREEKGASLLHFQRLPEKQPVCHIGAGLRIFAFTINMTHRIIF